MNPNGWSRKHLHEIASTFSGGTPSRRRPEYFNGTIPWIKSGEVNQRFIHHVEEFITQSALDDSSAKVVPPNSILVAMYGATAGKVGMSQFAAAINQAILAVRPNHHVANDYLFYFLEQALEKLAATHVQGGQPNLNAQIIRGVEVLLPPLAEQQRIVAILQTWEAAIKQLDHLIASKRERKRGLMQVLLTGKKRLPKYQSSGAFRRLGLSQLAEVDRHSLPNSTPGDRRFHYVSLSDIHQGRISNDLPVLEFSEAPSRARKLVAKNDVLLATVRPNLQAFALVGDEARSLVVSTGFAVLSARHELDPQYLFQYLFSSDITRQIESVVAGSNYPAISTRDVRKLKLNIPTIEEQRDIAAVLSTADSEINNLEQQLEAYKLQKRGLMQQLLTGKKRVKVDEVEAVA